MTDFSYRNDVSSAQRVSAEAEVGVGATYRYYLRDVAKCWGRPVSEVWYLLRAKRIRVRGASEAVDPGGECSWLTWETLKKFAQAAYRGRLDASARRATFLDAMWEYRIVN